MSRSRAGFYREEAYLRKLLGTESVRGASVKQYAEDKDLVFFKFKYKDAMGFSVEKVDLFISQKAASSGTVILVDDENIEFKVDDIIVINGSNSRIDAIKKKRKTSRSLGRGQGKIIWELNLE